MSLNGDNKKNTQLSLLAAFSQWKAVFANLPKLD